MEQSKINRTIQRTKAQNQMPQSEDRLQKLINWVKNSKTRRAVDVTIDGTDSSNIEIWAYDYSLREGELINLEQINSIDKLDLKAKSETRQQEEYEALKAKFEKRDMHD